MKDLSGGEEGPAFSGMADIADKRIAVMMESTHDKYITANFPRAEILRLDNAPDLVVAFSERDNETSVVFAAAEAVLTILNEVADSDGLSLALITGIARSVSEEMRDGKVVLTIVLKKGQKKAAPPAKRSGRIDQIAGMIRAWFPRRS
ncbi:MAG: hypothetical protein ACYDH3_05380 [Candidatus Aminicenantales bacterium]